MKSIYTSIAAAFMMSVLASPVSAASDELKVYSNLFGSVANIVVWQDNQPVSGGTVAIHDKTGRVIAQGDINSQGRAHIQMLGGRNGQAYTVTAESSNMSGQGSLVLDQRQTATR